MRKKKFHTKLMEEIASEGVEAGGGVPRRVEKQGNVRFNFFFFVCVYLLVPKKKMKSGIVFIF